jgi:hypothetical protein
MLEDINAISLSTSVLIFLDKWKRLRVRMNSLQQWTLLLPAACLPFNLAAPIDTFKMSFINDIKRSVCFVKLVSIVVTLVRWNDLIPNSS